jgi:hypothetical protein
MSLKTTTKLLLILTGITILLHLSVLLGFIPYDVAWGDKIKSTKQLFVFETISILATGFFGMLVLIKGQYIKLSIPERMINAMLWFFLLLFIMNTASIFAVKTDFQKLMSVITLLFSMLIAVTLRAKAGTNKVE